MIVKNVSIIGLGYVGLPLALLASRKGYDVTGIDVDKEKVSLIQKGIDPIGEPYVASELKDTRLRVSSNASVISKCQVVIVCVPTPVKKDHQPDLSLVKAAVSTVAKFMRRKTLIIIESTINPGVCDEIIIPQLELETGLKVNDDFFVSHCPERINPGDKNWSVENIPRVVGSSSTQGLSQTVDFYESILDASVKKMASLKEAEACKVVENSFRDINIAFVNELAKSFTKLGINVKNVIDGAATKPFAFMAHYPSVGVGGHCIPVDPYYLIEYARGYGFEHEFLSLARTINNSMPEFTVDQLIDALNEVGLTLKGSKIAVLGLSYKANVADDRESPSYKVISILKDKGAKVQSYDPYITDKSSAKSIDNALKGATAAIIATNHASLINIDFGNSDLKVIVDGKNCLDPEVIRRLKIIYRGIGV